MLAEIIWDLMGLAVAGGAIWVLIEVGGLLVVMLISPPFLVRASLEKNNDISLRGIALVFLTSVVIGVLLFAILFRLASPDDPSCLYWAIMCGTPLGIFVGWMAYKI